MPRPCVIFDIDGTLADPNKHPDYKDKGKKPTNQLDNYEQYISVLDPVPRIVAAAQNIAAQGIDIVILTCRPVAWKSDTVKWLKAQGVPYVKLGMRANSDKRDDDAVKQDMLKSLVNGGYDPLVAFENNKSNRKMFEAHNVPVVFVRDTHK